jgi:hypothetical protein
MALQESRMMMTIAGRIGKENVKANFQLLMVSPRRTKKISKATTAFDGKHLKIINDELS